MKQELVLFAVQETPSVIATDSSFFSQSIPEARSSSGTYANTSERFENHLLAWNQLQALLPISDNWGLFYMAFSTESSDSMRSSI